jgi:hypothetical protein
MMRWRTACAGPPFYNELQYHYLGTETDTSYRPVQGLRTVGREGFRAWRPRRSGFPGGLAL